MYRNAFSLTLNNGEDNLVTIDRAEHDALISEGWVDNCSPITGPSDFCVNSNELDGRNGPFILYNVLLPDTRPLYRCCLTPQIKHYVSVDPDCEGGKTESMLGYIAVRPGNDTVRALRRCRNSDRSAFHHALDLACDIDDSPILGWVR